jgi:hypothetical protein
MNDIVIDVEGLHRSYGRCEAVRGNADFDRHAAHLTIEGRPFHLAADRDQTVEGGLIIEQPGSYLVYCSVDGHREAGMEASLVVQ